MTRKQSLTPEEQWQNFWIAMAEIDMSLTDEEVLAEVRADGEDPDQIAAEVHAALMRGFHKAQRRKLNAGAQQQAEQVAELAKNKHVLPATPDCQP